MVTVFFGFFNAFCVRINFNIALVAMVNFTQANVVNYTSDECPEPTGNNTTPMSQVKFW